MTDHIVPNTHSGHGAGLRDIMTKGTPIKWPLDECPLCQINNCLQTIEDDVVLHAPKVRNATDD